jgi:hypothetical protein
MFINTFIKGTIEQQDEIKAILNARYVSAPEACWKLFLFKIHKEFPAHQRLTIHLEGKKPVSFNEDDDLNDVLSRADAQETTLTVWFKINETDENAGAILYPNFPEQYVWHNNKAPKRRALRQRGFGVQLAEFMLFHQSNQRNIV